MFEGLHQGRILCAAVADDTTLLTAGDSTVRYCNDMILISVLTDVLISVLY